MKYPQIPVIVCTLGGLFFSQVAYTQKNSVSIDPIPLQKKIEDLKRESARINKNAEKTDSLMVLEKQNHEKWEKSRLAEFEKRKMESSSLKEKIESLKNEISAEKTKQKKLESRSKDYQLKLEGTRVALIEACKELEKAIEASLPWKTTNRIEKVQLLRKELELNSVSNDEAFSRFSSIYNEEIKFGDEVAVHNEPITRKNGEVINAQILRMGNQFLIYMDEEAKKFGMLSKSTEKFVWTEDLGFEARNAIKHALDVKLAKKPPQLVNIPVPLDVMMKKEGE